MRAIIAGAGEIAYQFARELAETRDTVVILEDGEDTTRFDRLDVQVIAGSAADVEVLAAIEADAEDDFIACSDTDEKNIIACLTAKESSGGRTICFVSKEEHYRTFAPRSGHRPWRFIDRIIWPQYMLAEEIARTVLVPRAIYVEILAGGRIVLQEYRIEEKSRLVDRALAALGLHPGVLAVAVARGEEFTVPGGDFTLQVGDKVTFMGTPGALRSLERDFFVKRGEEKVRNVAIIGGGNVGGILAELLEEAGDVGVKIIEPNLERCEELAARLTSTLVLNGDGTDLELLDVEQIYLSDVLVAVTSDDEKNLLCALLAREMEIPKTITRVGSAMSMHLFESLGIDVPLNPRRTAVRTVLGMLQDTRSRLLAVTEQGKGNVFELDVPPAFEPTCLSDLPDVAGAIIGAIIRRGETFVPHGSDRVEPGDRLIVFSTLTAAPAVENFF